MKKIRIALDGPSGAGKSTIAKNIAKKLEIDYIDTGAMYRGIAYKVVQKNILPENETDVAKMLENTEIDFSQGDIILDGEVINDKIRTPEISIMSSKCSAIGAVRAKLVELQRYMGEKKSVIMDGRDIGTNVMPNAEYKFFLTATPEERANRRFDELIKKGQNVSYEEVLEDIVQRDFNDMNRKLNPLRKAEDAIEIDSTGKTIDEVTNIIVEHIKNK